MPIYDLIIGKQTMHDLGVKLDFQEKTITIDKILLPMRNITNLQLRPRITRALRENTCFGQKPISTRSATKCMVKILDAKYEKADLPAIIREICSHLTAAEREKLLSVLLKYKPLCQAMWLSGRPMLLVAEVRGSIPAKHRGWSRR